MSEEPAVGEYHGRPTRRLASDHLWVDVLATAGPRIVRLGLTGSGVNLLAETPDEGWETPNGRYELFGGHRLWFAPEDPDRVAVPDTDGLDLAIEKAGIRLTGAVEPVTGLVRSISLRLDPDAAVLELDHELCNVGTRPIELSPWAITQLPLGGTVILPQPAAKDGHHVRPNRSLVLWPYTSWEDDRLDMRDGSMLVHARPGRRLKLGYFNEAGWVGYLRDGALLVRRFEPAVGRRHPDLGCNVETYCHDRFLELELLGPLAEIAPGTSVVQTERWQVSAVPSGGVDEALRTIAATG
ncbi:MAG TPA: hypothetical protein VK656_00230 [Candidatus Acidoferrum sp.]|nr:hypothetical protein [Candidatus Acidoferrum sp.]